MSKFPVEIGDQAGIVDAVNYVLSGPTYPDTSAQGFSTDQTSDMTGNFREPWTGVGTGILYVAPIALTSTTWLDDYTLRFDFAAAQPTPPFSLGNNLFLAGITPAGYDGYYSGAGVVECTTTYVIIRTRTAQPNIGAGTGGTVEFSAADPTLAPTIMSTDCNTKVTVNYSNSQVAINAQLENTITYSTIGATQALYQVQINRYKGFPDNDPINPGFFFQYDGNVALKEYVLDLTDTTNNITSIAIDPAPPPPYTNTRTQAALAYPETYLVVNTATTGSGSGVKLSVKIAAGFPAAPPQLYTAANTTIEIVEAGQDYQVNDLVIIDGADIGGVTGVDDLVLIIGAVGIPNPDLFYANTFTGVVDRPEIGYYWYILEVYFETTAGDLYIHRCSLGQRSLTAQVIKQ